MEITKSEDGNYHIAADKDEWFLIHVISNYLNENYDKIDEFILNRFDAQEEVAAITEKINKAYTPDQDENYILINYEELHLLSNMLEDIITEQTDIFDQFNNNNELIKTLTIIADKLFSMHTEKLKEKQKMRDN